ncbi:MAG: DUF87 domain-containing protein, partial [Planctomycetota bacterium]|nr:DUF87 domain-containing protein [Planctomycetota bacterium]
MASGDAFPAPAGALSRICFSGCSSPEGNRAMSGRNTRQLYSLIKHYNLDATEGEYRDVVFRIEQGLMSEDEARAWLIWIWPHIERAKDHPNYLHRPPTAAELNADGPPDVELGHLVHAPDVRWGIRYRDQPRSILIVGKRGSGKTNTFLAICTRAYEQGLRDPSRRVIQIIFDRKDDFIHLRQLYGPDWMLLDFHDGRTRLGFNAPDGVPPPAWINRVATIFSARGGMVAGWTCFAGMMNWLLAALNPHPGLALRWPCPKSLLQLTQVTPFSLWSAKDTYEKTAIGVLQSTVQATTLFDCFSGLDIHRDVPMGKNLIVRLPNFEPAWLRLVAIEIILSQLFLKLLHTRAKVDRTIYLIHIDEGDQDATAASDAAYPDLGSTNQQLSDDWCDVVGLAMPIWCNGTEVCSVTTRSQGWLSYFGIGTSRTSRSKCGPFGEPCRRRIDDGLLR